VTNRMYALCVDAGVCLPPNRLKSTTRETYFGAEEFADFPVIHVSWEQAAAYCQWAGKRLPSEAEWEKAARGTDGRIYPWGDAPYSCEKANYWGYEQNIGGHLTSVGCSKDTEQVASFSGESPYGVFDMVGNVAEWVADGYDEKHLQNIPDRNPPPAEDSGWRVIRGTCGYEEFIPKYDTKPPNYHGGHGGIFTYGTVSKPVKNGKILFHFTPRLTYRSWARPNTSAETVGFRCASDL
jgi:formylglycine-generating enzyme required for sulfatase activity